jgi:hypothetical protein
MCGLVDYQALQTSITRLAALTSLGAAAYGLRRLASLWRERKQRRGDRKEGRQAIGLAGALVESRR